MAFLEIACFDAKNAIIAADAGADRIELCSNRDVGGTTPSVDSVAQVTEHIRIPVFVMIRPRGGNFRYSNAEFNQMKTDIDRFKSKVDGYVLGILDQDNKVDIQRTTELVMRANPHPCTFHRAFDETPDALIALEDVISTGCRAILTSGGAANAISGASVISGLVKNAQGKIAIMPGGGVRSEHISELQALTKTTLYHSSALLHDGDKVDAHEIRQMKSILRGLPE